MFDTVKVGKIISQKRKEHNMTQLALADKLGVSFQAVSNWERGYSMPDISKLPELAALFGCSIEELLGGGQPAERVEKIAKAALNELVLTALERGEKSIRDCCRSCLKMFSSRRSAAGPNSNAALRAISCAEGFKLQRGGLQWGIANLQVV